MELMYGRRQKPISWIKVFEDAWDMEVGGG